MIANLLLFIFCFVFLFYNKSTLTNSIIKYLNILFSWEGVLYLSILLVFAFFTSRGTIHTDTSLYHAQAIRWYEEYGVVKGLANLQWHFAYNSSYFAFAALFSMTFLGNTALHCTTGFLAAVFCLFALSHLKEFFIHPRHMADMCCIGILFYALVNLPGCISPASDYAAMFFSLYLIARWAQEIEAQTQCIENYCLLSFLAVFIATLKLSAALLVLLALYPLVHLIRTKKMKTILLCLVFGIMIALPFLIRNIIISGWLLYPFPAIDLFSFDWKLPVQYVNIDAATIKVWARCLYDPAMIDMPIQEWIPIWWNAQERYAQALILTNLLAFVLDILILLHHTVILREPPNFSLYLLNIVIFLNAAAWLLLAPFIRYGLAFLLAIPLISVGMWLRKSSREDLSSPTRAPGGRQPDDIPHLDARVQEKSSFYKLLSGCMIVLMFFILTPYWDHYFTDDVVFIKQNLTEPYYIRQKDYAHSEMIEYDMNGITIYTPKEGDINGYNYFPSSAYDFMITCTELRTGVLKDGFRNAEFKRE